MMNDEVKDGVRELLDRNSPGWGFAFLQVHGRDGSPLGTLSLPEGVAVTASASPPAGPSPSPSRSSTGA